ncbi:MAG: hypothetical protein HY735_24575 [Verrucomicrobia bacterium]|nr:hypothetical protein [Verrucomicrobiota bacterium]
MTTVKSGCDQSAFLQSTADLNDPKDWNSITNTPFADGLNNSLYFPASGPKSFYRLIKP